MFVCPSFHCRINIIIFLFFFLYYILFCPLCIIFLLQYIRVWDCYSVCVCVYGVMNEIVEMRVLYMYNIVCVCVCVQMTSINQLALPIWKQYMCYSETFKYIILYTYTCIIYCFFFRMTTWFSTENRWYLLIHDERELYLNTSSSHARAKKKKIIIIKTVFMQY